MAKDIRTKMPPVDQAENTAEPPWTLGLGQTAHEVMTTLASLRLTVWLFALGIFIVFAGTLAQVDYEIWYVVNRYFRIDFTGAQGVPSPLVWIDLKVLASFFTLFMGRRPPTESAGDAARLALALVNGLLWPLVTLIVFAPKDWLRKMWVWGLVYAPVAFAGIVFIALMGGFWFPKGWTIGLVMATNLVAAHLIRFKAQAGGVRLASGIGLIVAGCAATALVILGGSNKDGLTAAALVQWGTVWDIFLGTLAATGLASIYGGLRLRGDRLAERLFLLFCGAALVAVAGWLYVDDSMRLYDSGMRILWQLLKATFAGLVLLAGCYLVFRKRAGVVLLHAGVGLMMLGELLVGLNPVEGQMQIAEGETVDFSRDIRHVELAIVQGREDKDAAEYQEVVVPGWKLRADEPITDERLPFDVEVVKYLVNSKIEKAGPTTKNPADSGVGRAYVAVPLKASTGTDNADQVDLASAYVRLTDKESKKPLGTWLVSQELTDRLIEPQTVTVDGTEYAVELRFKREYKPYSVHLLEVSKKDYVGTDIPMDYRSIVQVHDRERDLKSTVHIWMNNPLRFGGETFYQSGYHRDPQTGKEYTVLQVVENRGWMIPYVSCMIVAVGMLAHFGVVLVRFLNRRRRERGAVSMILTGGLLGLLADLWRSKEEAALRARGIDPDIKLEVVDAPRWPMIVFPTLAVLVIGLWLGSKARLPDYGEKDFDLHTFGQIPIVNEGRVKPIDTLARVTLRGISNYEEWREQVEIDGKKEWRRHPATEWLLEVVTTEPEQWDHRVIKLDHPRLLSTLELPRDRAKHLYSYAELQRAGRRERFAAELAMVRQVPEDRRESYHVQVLDLERRLRAIEQLKQMLSTFPLKGDKAVRALHAVNQIREGDTQQKFPLLVYSPAVDRWEPYILPATRTELEQRIAAHGEDGATHVAREIARDGLPLLLVEMELEKLSDTLRGLRPLLRQRVGERAMQMTVDEIAAELLKTGGAQAADGGMKGVFEALVAAGERTKAGEEVNPLQVIELLPEASFDYLYEQSLAQLPGGDPAQKVADAVERTTPGMRSIIEQMRLDRPGAKGIESQAARPREKSLAEVVAAFEQNDPRAFNERVETYLAAIQKDAPHLPDHPDEALNSGLVRKEAYFNHLAPFYHLLWPYLFAALLSIGAWLGWSQVLNRTAFALILFTFILHTWALYERMLISGRPPVTNLYSSFIFVGWGGVLLGLIFERISKLGLGNLAAGLAGCSTLTIAHLMFNSGDTIQVLQAVLDTGFWLATHVVIITLGYATTYIAGLFGIIYLVMGIATPSLTPRHESELTRMIYGTIAFSIFFSFVGTVLGGLWADDSWGRFWGWDPKENGALIIVLWNALVLHARWGGLVKDRGLAVLAVAGNIAVTWSWIGVNQLGEGLHSYGFTEGMSLLLGAAWAGHMALIACCLVPKSMWWSYLARQRAGD